jgi:glycosyltransferase involved in cell wall biosynthesis
VRSGRRRRLGLVVQHYGEGVTGGSESLARALAERLAADQDVAVFTTCARDYVSWSNELPEGVDRLAGVEVRRYPVAEQRDLGSFNQLSERLYAGARSRQDELAWLRRQGPYCPALVEALGRARDDFDAFVFFTYLYYPTYWGLKEVGERSVLVPTTHDEPPLAFSLYDEVFAAARAFAFLTPPERDLVERRFGIGGRPAVVAGIGVELGGEGDVAGFRIRRQLARPYALYAGRIDEGKGCGEMIDFFERYRRDVPGGLDLVLIGRLAMALPPLPGVRCLGFLPDAEKRSALAGARVVLCPSPFESLSIALLEGLALGTPALVNARSPVLKDHCLRSNAGLYYEDAETFAEALDLLATDRALHGALAANGQVYVAREYRWDTVLARYLEVIDRVASAPVAS